MANSHKRNNGIESLMVDGILSLDQGMIADCITQFFMKLYSKEQVDRPFPEVLVFPRISSDNADYPHHIKKNIYYVPKPTKR